MSERREPRLFEGQLLRALIGGLVLGALFGVAVLLPDVLTSLRPPAPDVAQVVTASWLPVGAAYGAGIGLVSGLTAVLTWGLTGDVLDDVPRWHRLVGALGAGLPLVVIGLLTGFGLGAPIGTAVAVLAAFLAEPYVAYRPAPASTKSTELSVINGA